jgi:hypothetical protein
MENIHPAAIKPKINKNKYINVIRNKYSNFSSNIKGGYNSNEYMTANQIYDDSNTNPNLADIIDKDNDSNIYENEIKEEVKKDELDGKRDYKYIGALATMAGQIGVILYWFITS